MSLFNDEEQCISAGGSTGLVLLARSSRKHAGMLTNLKGRARRIGEAIIALDSKSPLDKMSVADVADARRILKGQENARQASRKSEQRREILNEIENAIRKICREHRAEVVVKEIRINGLNFVNYPIFIDEQPEKA